MQQSTYAIGLGSNRRHGRHGAPARIVAAALDAMALAGLRIVDVSPTTLTAPMGPSARHYANAIALIETPDDPPALLARLKAIERAFGRRPGRRWGARVLDLDIVLWSGGIWTSPSLAIPHPAFRARRFVLDPLVHIAPDWRDPLTHLTIRQLRTRLTRRRPVPR